MTQCLRQVPCRIQGPCVDVHATDGTLESHLKGRVSVANEPVKPRPSTMLLCLLALRSKCCGVAFYGICVQKAENVGVVQLRE